MRAVSLEYHDVIAAGDVDDSGFAGPDAASYKLSAAEFGRHLEAVGRTIRRPPARVIDWLRDGAAEFPLFLTFDDGGASAYTRIGDALERHGWRGHFFVTAGKIGASTFLSPPQIRALHARGHVIGTHSHSHPTRIGACTSEQILVEWQRSTAILADIIGEPIIVGSVPGGYYRRRVGEAAARAGMKLLFTSAPTTRCDVVDLCRVLGRYTLRSWSSAKTASRLANAQCRPRTTQWLLYNSLALLRLMAGDRYARWRQRFWATRARLDIS